MSQQSPVSQQAQSSSGAQLQNEPQSAPGSSGGQQVAGQQGGGQQSGGQQVGGQQIGGQQSGTQRGGGRQPGEQGGARQLFPSHNFLDDEVRATSVQLCNQVLADLVVLQSHVETAHWNVRGPDFYQLHELFDDVAEMLGGYVDDVAERATALGGVAAGDVHQAVQRSTLQPMPPSLVEGTGLVDCIAADVAAVDRTLYWEMQRAEEIGDLDTVDLLNEVSRAVAKALWFVEAHLQGPGAKASPAVGRFEPQAIGASQPGAGQSGAGQPRTEPSGGAGGQPPAQAGSPSGARQTRAQW